jgi:DNA-binding PadR family transcriptional regulator
VFNRNGGGHRRFGGVGHPGYGRHYGGGGRGLRGGRMVSAADLQLIIAAFLAEKPRHGYEIIKAVQERSNGYYTPSAGMVYPSLTYLEEIGYASVAADGARKLYSLTDAGKSHVKQNRERVTALFSELTRVGQKMQRAQRAYEGESGAPAGSLDEVRRDLKAALFDAFDAPAAEQSRVAEILSRALAEINKR